MKILLAIDGSEGSENAVEAVASRPWPSGTTVRVLSVIEAKLLLAAELGYDSGLNRETARQEMTKRAEALTTRVAHSLSAKGLTADRLVRVGDPREEIVNEAKEWTADLIVVGSHGDTGIRRWLLGSVAQSVVRHAPCSVEVIRKRSAEESEA
jgi:nucleotide-binding universal stress UspA family protein